MNAEKHGYFKYSSALSAAIRVLVYSPAFGHDLSDGAVDDEGIRIGKNRVTGSRPFEEISQGFVEVAALQPAVEGDDLAGREVELVFAVGEDDGHVVVGPAFARWAFGASGVTAHGQAQIQVVGVGPDALDLAG